MNKSEKFDEDILSRYIGPGKGEKAPEGFTQRTMVRLQSEKAPVLIREKSGKYYIVPVVSALITLALVIAATFSTTSLDLIPDLSVLKSIRSLSFFETNISKLFPSTLPEILIYISLGIFMLLVFDQLLSRVFHKERK